MSPYRRALVWPLILLALVWPYPHQAQGPGAIGAAPHADPPPPQALLVDPKVQVAHQLIQEVNRTRREHGQLPPLKVHPALERAAHGHSQDMAANDFFGHKGSEMSSPWDRIEAQGYDAWFVLAENIAVGYATPEEVIQAWLDSPEHRTNMLNPEMREAGGGYAFEQDDTHPGDTWGYQHYWTLDMGACPNVFPLIIEDEAYSTTARVVGLYLHGYEGVAEMRLSNDGHNWTPWLHYQRLKLWELAPGDGLKRVYAEIRDGQGNQYQSYDEIVLQNNPTPPPQAAAALQVWPEQVLFVLPEGQSGAVVPRQYKLRITEDEDGVLAWHANWEPAWLRLSTDSGIAPSLVILTLTEQVDALSPGVYTVTLEIEGEGQCAQLTVHLLIFPEVYRVYLPYFFDGRP